jgi:hypothetical protein
MSSRQINTLLKTLAAIMIIVAVVVVVGSIVVPVKTDPSQQITETTSARDNAAASDLPPLSEFEPVFTASLRGSSVAPSTQPALASAAGLTLVGTVGDRVALVRGAGTEEVEARLVGEKIDGNELVAVRAGEVDMRTADGVVTLKKQPDTQTPEYIHGAKQQ